MNKAHKETRSSTKDRCGMPCSCDHDAGYWTSKKQAGVNTQQFAAVFCTQ